MANFLNLDGTTNSSFKIGPRGITITTKEIRNKDNLKKVLAVQYSEAEIKELLLEDDIRIPTAYCSGVSKDENNSITSFIFKTFDRNTRQWIEETIEVNSVLGTGDVIGAESSTAGNLVSFADNSGKKLSDSRMSVSDNVLTDASKDDHNTVPTAAAVIGYVGTLSDCLAARLSGETQI